MSTDPLTIVDTEDTLTVDTTTDPPISNSTSTDPLPLLNNF